MSKNLQKYNIGSFGNYVNTSSASYNRSSSTITQLSATEIDATWTKSDGSVYTYVIKGSFDVSAYTSSTKTLADLVSSSPNVLVNSITQYRNSTLDETASISPSESLNTYVYGHTSLANLNSDFSENDVFTSSNSKTTTNNDNVYGYAGNDSYYDNHYLMTKIDVFYGGNGTDTAVLPSKYANYTIKTGAVFDVINQNIGLTGYTITDNTKTFNTLQINQVERVQFTDGTLAVDFSQGQSAYQSAMMIGAAFGENHVNTYFSAGLFLYDQGQTNLQVATLIESMGLIESQIGSISNTAYVNFIYKNVVGITPDTLTESMFVNALNTGVYTKASLLALAAGVSNLEQQIDLTGLQQNGLFYHPINFI